MNVTRDRLLLGAGLVSVGLGAWLLFAPGTVPALGPLESLTDIDTATQVGLLLGLVVAALAAFQMRRTARATLDRSDLLDAPPEQANDAAVPAPSAPLAESYERLRGRIEQLGRAGWHVVAYGRRARHTTDHGDDQSREPSGARPPEQSPSQSPEEPSPQSPERSSGRSPDTGPADGGGPETGAATQPGYSELGPFGQQTRAELLDLLDEMAVTARDTYATATGCDEATAREAVATGEWTDDRIAAAFLATDADAPTFTVPERALAWLTPRRTLDRRLERTLEAIEAHADGYLTYRTPSTGVADIGGTGPDERREGGASAGDAGNGTHPGRPSGSASGDGTGEGVSSEDRSGGDVSGEDRSGDAPPREATGPAEATGGER